MFAGVCTQSPTTPVFHGLYESRKYRCLYRNPMLRDVVPIDSLQTGVAKGTSVRTSLGQGDRMEGDADFPSGASESFRQFRIRLAKFGGKMTSDGLKDWISLLVRSRPLAQAPLHLSLGERRPSGLPAKSLPGFRHRRPTAEHSVSDEITQAKSATHY
jgi:hypothetical protein